MKPVSHVVRITMVFCAMSMLLSQIMGLHFHRHMLGGPADHATTLHTLDSGVHLHEDTAAHHAAGDRASHPDEDVEIDPLGAGLAKFSKVLLHTAFLFVAVLCLFLVMPGVPAGFDLLRRCHPALFFLKPPSNAPPLKPSFA